MSCTCNLTMKQTFLHNTFYRTMDALPPTVQKQSIHNHFHVLTKISEWCLLRFWHGTLVKKLEWDVYYLTADMQSCKVPRLSCDSCTSTLKPVKTKPARQEQILQGLMFPTWSQTVHIRRMGWGVVGALAALDNPLHSAQNSRKSSQVYKTVSVIVIKTYFKLECECISR